MEYGVQGWKGKRYGYYIYVLYVCGKGVIRLFTLIVELSDSLFPIGLDSANLNIDYNTITYNIYIYLSLSHIRERVLRYLTLIHLACLTGVRLAKLVRLYGVVLHLS